MPMFFNDGNLKNVKEEKQKKKERRKEEEDKEKREKRIRGTLKRIRLYLCRCILTLTTTPYSSKTTFFDE